jgi:hypothetical protein
MSWQLWVLVAAAASGCLAVIAVKIHRAQQVFDRIVDEADDLARQRRRRQQSRPALILHSAHPQHRSRGHH